MRIFGYSVFVCLCAVMFIGCGDSIDTKGSQTDAELFEYGKNCYEQREYKKALQYFLYVKDHFLKSEYAGLTRFYAGESYFGLKKYEDATIEYKSFLSFFSNDPHAPIAQYKLGVCYYKQSLGPERDQTMINKALIELQKVQANYPENKESVRKAEEQLQRTKEKLSLHEYLVARFYRKENHYTGSNKRLLYLLENYPESRQSGDALYMMGLNYLELKQKEDAKEPFLRIVQYYPNHQRASDARKHLAQLGVTDLPEPMIQTKTVQQAKETSHEEKAPSKPQQPQSAFSEGYVVLIRDNKVFTDLIREDGIREGMILEVYRDNQMIGTIRLIEIQEGFSIGEVDTLVSGMMLQEEDKVVIPK